MAERRKSLAERREELVARSSIQREQLVAQIAGIRPSGTGTLSSGKNILAQVRKNPLLSGVLAFSAFLFLRSHRLFSLFATGLVVMKAWQRLLPWIMPVFGKLKQLRRKKR